MDADYYSRNGETVSYTWAGIPGTIVWSDQYGAKLDIPGRSESVFVGWEFIATENETKAAEFEARAAVLRSETCTCANCA